MHDERFRPRERGLRRYKFLIPLMHGEPPQPGPDTKQYLVVKPFFWSRRKARVLQNDDLTLYEPAAFALTDSGSTIHLSERQAAELLKEGLVREGCHSRQRPGKRRG